LYCCWGRAALAAGAAAGVAATGLNWTLDGGRADPCRQVSNHSTTNKSATNHQPTAFDLGEKRHPSLLSGNRDGVTMTGGGLGKTNPNHQLHNDDETLENAASNLSLP
jgi:hypothetical protein